jgi:hypothetical protein
MYGVDLRTNSLASDGLHSSAVLTDNTVWYPEIRVIKG